MRRLGSFRFAAILEGAQGTGGLAGARSDKSGRPYCRSERSLGASGRGSENFQNVVAGAIFALVALLHLLRIYMGWPIVIGSWTAPIWVSWIGFVVAGGLSYFGLSLATRR